MSTRTREEKGLVSVPAATGDPSVETCAVIARSSYTRRQRNNRICLAIDIMPPRM
jgi:hypothetical protein